MRVPFSYLPEQFADPEPIFAKIRQIVATGDFTLGSALTEFESSFAALVDVRHAIGVNSGTDALRLSLKAIGVGPGDEVITAANTFIATVSAIDDIGAKAVFVDCTDDLCMDLSLLERAITARTRAVIPVHLSGAMVDMQELLRITEKRGIPVIEDACQAICSSLDGRAAGAWGVTGAFSLHPLKYLNIWGDGGVITTNNDALATKLRLLRNHGLETRDIVVMPGCNSRLDSIQAAVASHVLNQAEGISSRRIANSEVYDREFAQIPAVQVPPRDKRTRHSFVTYQLFVDRRDALVHYCVERGIECKVHYPIPAYCQVGLRHLGYKAGDFPVTDRHALSTITLPVHQYLSGEQLAYVVATIKEFYRT